MMEPDTPSLTWILPPNFTTPCVRRNEHAKVPGSRERERQRKRRNDDDDDDDEGGEKEGRKAVPQLEKLKLGNGISVTHTTGKRTSDAPGTTSTGFKI